MENESKPDIGALIESDDTNGSIIELDNYVCALCDWGDALENLSVPQKNFYFNQNLEREVNNGGFHQFFFNSSGEFAHETLESLKEIGAQTTAEWIRRAIDEFPGGKVPTDTEERRELMLKLWPESENEVWEELDQKFYTYEDDLNALNLAYIRTNLASF
jgi:hypothetical protein